MPSGIAEDEPVTMPVVRRIDHAIDYLSHLLDRYRQYARLPHDNPWREGAQQWVEELTAAVALLRQARAVAGRRSTSEEMNADGFVPPAQQAQTFINEAATEYSRARSDAARRFTPEYEPIPYCEVRNRAEQISRLLANTCNRVLYREDVL